MKDKIHFWVTSLYGEDKKNPRYKLFKENLKRVPSLKLNPSIDGRNPLQVLQKWIDLNENNPIVFSNKRRDSNTKNKWGSLACYLTKLLYFLEYCKIGGDALCLTEDDVILPEGFEDYVSQALEFSKENYNNEKILRLGPFGEIYILPHSMRKKLIKHLLLIDQAVDQKINNSGFCVHYYDYVNEIDGYKKIVNKYNPTSQKNIIKGRPFIFNPLKNCLMIEKDNQGDIPKTDTLGIFEKVFAFWDDPQFRYSQIVKKLLKFNEK